MVRFKSSEDTLLIDMVIEHPVLWNPKSADFNDRVKRDEVWRAIGRTLNRSGNYNTDYIVFAIVY